MVSPLQNAVTFFKDFGLFDVVLPFLLVFSIMFAILEKTRILGTEKIKGEEVTKRSLNTMVAFVIAMIVVATNKIVTAINETLPNVVFIIIAFVAFLLMIGVFFNTGEFNFAKSNPKAMIGFTIVSLILLVLIVLNSLKLDSGQSWLDWTTEYVVNNFSGPVVMSLVFLLVALFAVGFITKSTSKKE